VDSTGIFHISGGSSYNTGAVTFEGISFELPAGADVNCFGIKLLSGSEDRYASDVTVRNCEFIGNVEKSCALWSGSGSQPKNILIEGCKCDGLTALYNGYGSGITIKDSQLTNARGLLNSQSPDPANALLIENVDATIDYQPSKDMDAIKINGGNLTVKDSDIKLYYNGATRSSGLIVVRGAATIAIDNSTLTANKVGGDYDVYTFYGIAPASLDNTTFSGDLEGFTYGGTFEGGPGTAPQASIENLDTFNEGVEALDEEKPTEEETPDIAPLEAAIQEAIAAKEGVVVSEDGSDVPAGTYWVTQADMDALDAAIAAAEAAKETVKTQQDVDEAVEELEATVTAFNEAKQVVAAGEEELEETEVPVNEQEPGNDEEPENDEDIGDEQVNTEQDTGNDLEGLMETVNEEDAA